MWVCPSPCASFRLLPAACAASAVVAAAAAASGAGGGAALFAPNRVLVRFRATAAARARAQLTAPMAGLRLRGFAGRHHSLRVVRSSSNASTNGGGPGTQAGDHLRDSEGRLSMAAPAEAIMVFDIVDGSSVVAKVKELSLDAGKEGQRDGLRQVAAGDWGSSLSVRGRLAGGQVGRNEGLVETKHL